MNVIVWDISDLPQQQRILMGRHFHLLDILKRNKEKNGIKSQSYSIQRKIQISV